jgi:hypothetical protein
MYTQKNSSDKTHHNVLTDRVNFMRITVTMKGGEPPPPFVFFSRLTGKRVLDKSYQQ